MEHGNYQPISYDPVTGRLYRREQVAGRLREDGYIQINFQSKEHLAHRVVWYLVHGRWPTNDLDHRDGDKTNNRIENLREVTHGENMQNKVTPHKNNRSGYLGVQSHAGGYKAVIKKDGVAYYLGLYKTAEEAHQVYMNKKKELHIDSSQR